MRKLFPEVFCKYGAGPWGHSTRTDFSGVTELVHRVAGWHDGDYDVGGAYWGNSGDGSRIYAVWERGNIGEGIAYVRAKSVTRAYLCVFNGVRSCHKLDGSGVL